MRKDPFARRNSSEAGMTPCCCRPTLGAKKNLRLMKVLTSRLSTRHEHTQHRQGDISAFLDLNMAEDSFDTLVAILRDRDISYDRDALKAAYNDPEHQPTIREWIQEYLTPETLLTKDEAVLSV